MRSALLLAVATSACLALAAPAWPCGPPGSMENGGQGGGNANQSAGNAGPAEGGGRNSNDGGRDRGGSWDNAGGENARQGASDQAGRDLDNGDNSGPRRSSSDNANQGADYSNQIGAVGQAQAAGDAADCRTLKAQLDDLQNGPPTEAETIASQLNASMPRWMLMTPAMLDGEIKAEQARLDALQAQDQRAVYLPQGAGKPQKRSSATLNFLYDLRAAKLTGIGVDGMQRRADQAQGNAQSLLFQIRAQRDQQIHHLQNRIANQNCPTFLPSPSAASSPSPSASPSENQ